MLDLEYRHLRPRGGRLPFKTKLLLPMTGTAKLADFKAKLSMAAERRLHYVKMHKGHMMMIHEAFSDAVHNPISQSHIEIPDSAHSDDPITN